MALVSREEFFNRLTEVLDFVIADKTASVAREADLRAALADAGLPDDQVAEAQVDDAQVLSFFGAYRDLAAQVADPGTGGGTGELPTDPVDVPEVPEAPVEPTEPVTP